MEIPVTAHPTSEGGNGAAWIKAEESSGFLKGEKEWRSMNKNLVAVTTMQVPGHVP